MSLETIIWAFRQQVRPSARKFVLVALGDNAHDETGLAFPSIAAICFKTSQDRKTVMLALDKLVAMNLISDTGKRVGATMQVKVYRLDGYLRDSGRVPEAGQLNKPVFPAEQSRNSLVTVPKTGHGTATEPQTNSKKKSARLTDEEFLTALKQNPAYAHIDFERELAKMDAWLISPKGHGRTKTRQFILNWLNKADAALPTNGTHHKPTTESSRNLGTSNEGKSSQYRGIGKVRSVPDAQRSSA